MHRYRTVVVLNVAVFIMMVGVGMLMAILPARMIAFTGSPSSAGYLAAVFAAAYLLFQIPTGRLADRIGFRWLIGSGFVLCGFSGILFYRAESGAALLVGRILQGIGEVPIWALAPALLSICYPENKGRVIGVYNASMHLGLSVGPVIGLLLERFCRSPQAPIQFFIVASFAAGLLVWMLAPNTVGETRREQGATAPSFRNLLRRRSIQAMLAGVMLYGVGYGFFVTSIPGYLISVKRFTSTDLGIYFTLFYIAISSIQLTAGPLSDRYGRSGFMIAGLLLAFLGVVGFPALGRTGAMGLLFAAGLGLGMFYVASIAHLNEAVGAGRKGTISGLYFLAWGAGYFAGPLLAGIFGQHTGLAACFRLYGGLLLAQVVLMVLCRERRADPASEAAC